ncbi:hypothetical protein BV22DRAFT_1033145 [Leucogyrophana mollusca]|uniref:Uncharacterized protein n=1 Tax=Leucogyrophana mollusca TaxID=85980 RepID=A0ACB8BKU1_9AGAM|nr:hypothetical protein BV22DRAFT_1033145 [Leucogyrophana mollusca]
MGRILTALRQRERLPWSLLESAAIIALEDDSGHLFWSGASVLPRKSTTMFGNGSGLQVKPCHGVLGAPEIFYYHRDLTVYLQLVIYDTALSVCLSPMQDSHDVPVL